MIDTPAITEALRLFIGSEQVFEIRVLEAITPTDRRPHTLSGYFDNVESAAAAVAKVQSAMGFYFTPNPVKPELLARAVNKLRAPGKQPTTSDHDVAARRWLLIDCDPVRPAGIASADVEHQSAISKAGFIAQGLAGDGWPEPITCDSGNGAHLCYRIDLPADDGGITEGCLKALSARFSDAQVKVDETTFNPARIWKLYGTTAGKGDVDAEKIGRPQRMSQIIGIPSKLECVSVGFLQSLTTSIPTDAPPARQHTRSNDGFDIETWIRSHGLDIADPTPWRGGRRWIFKVCPWNSSHTNGSAWIIEMPSGAVAAGCHHDGCKGRAWRDLRELYEPSRIRQPRQTPLPTTKPTLHSTTFQAATLAYVDLIERGIIPCIPSGLLALDQSVDGISAGELCVVAARPGHGKSAFAFQWLDNAALNHTNCLIISEEMGHLEIGKRRLLSITNIGQELWGPDSAAYIRKDVIEYYEKRAAVHIVESCNTIARAEDAIEQFCAAHGVTLVAVDYLQLLTAQTGDRYEVVTEISRRLKQAAKRCNCAIIALSQLNREIEKRSDQEPKLSDLRESGQIEQDADLILFLQWPHKFSPDISKSEYRIYAAKRRNGPIRTPRIVTQFNPETQYFGGSVVVEREYEPTPY